MARLQSLPLLLLLLLTALIALASASAPTFCKCTCFKNSTIIPLGPEHQLRRSLPAINDHLSPQHRAEALSSSFDDSSSSPSPAADHTPENGNNSPPHLRPPRSVSTSCTECTKAFCLSQGIDFCKDAKDADVTTLCFQRDSNKDKIVVWGFIFATAGLLGWAAFKRVVEYRDARRAAAGHSQGGQYTAMSRR